MTRLDKLIEKICARPPTARFSDVDALLAAFGWRRDRTKGSHVVYVKDGEGSMTIPTESGRLVKRVYLDDICERFGLEDGE